MSLLVSFNNIYSSIKEVIRFLDYPLNKDLEKVISNIDSGKSITDSYNEFNEKYNNRTITLFNQTLELFNEHGDSDAGTVLHIISEEMNMLKIKKDKFLKFKKEWRLNFYVVVIMCMIMPIILKLMIPDIYSNYMDSFGSIVMIIIIFVNLVIIKKIESIYRNQSIGEGGYR
jgi:pilus assembly protein TadC